MKAILQNFLNLKKSKTKKKMKAESKSSRKIVKY
jgi:hypothetical protein